MNLQQSHNELKNEFEYSVDHATILAQIGDATVDAPADIDSETVDEILASDNDKIYETADDLFDLIYGNSDGS